MAEPTTADATEVSAAPARSTSKTIVTIVAVLLAIGGAAGGAYWLGAKKDADASAGADATDANKDAKKGAKAQPKGPAIYVEFDPPFVVNFEARGMTRFLQVSVQVLTRDPLVADMIKTHDPVIRNDLLMLFGGQTYETISTREGKDQLRSEALQAIAKVIESEGGKGESVEQLYFTSFVMQ